MLNPNTKNPTGGAGSERTTDRPNNVDDAYRDRRGGPAIDTEKRDKELKKSERTTTT